jgi:PAS domain S-box-containing protein
LAIIVSVFIIGYFLEETIDISGLNNPESLEQTFEIISELFSVFVALSIFSITWYAYNKSRDNHSLFLGATFLITGLLILFHLLSYPFMPDFISPNSPHKAAIFFLESRFLLAFLLLASVYVHKDSFPKLITKYVLVLSAIAIISVSLVFLYFYENFLFMTNNIDTYSTATVALLLFVITTIILTASYLYGKRAKETGQDNLNNIIYGSIIVIVSNLVYFFYEFSGHFLIITGFFYFYLGLYKTSIEQPYEKLATAEEKLRKVVENKYRTLFDNANDAIITTDLEDGVTSWNHSAEKLFGWEAQEVRGKKLSSIIVPFNLLGQEKVLFQDSLGGKFASGIETERFHKDGNRIFVDLTTSQLLDSNQNLIGLSFIFRDITQRKLAENTIEESFKKLQEEKAKTESIIAALGDAISIQDTDFKVLYQNKIHQDIIGDQKGKYCYREYEHRDNICEGCPMVMSFKDGKIHTGERSIQKDKKKLYFEITSSTLRDSTGNIIAGIEVARNITQRKLMEEALRKSRNLLDTIKNVQDNYIADFNMQVTFNDILNNLLSLTQSEYGFIGEILFNAKGEPYLKTHAITDIAWNKETQEFYKNNAPNGMEFCNLKTLFGAVMTVGKPILANNPSTDPRRGGLPEGHPPLNTFLGIPFYQGEKLIGMVGIANCPGGYDEDIIEYLNPLLNTCANIIEAYRNDQRRKLAEKQIEDSLKEKEVLLREIHHRVKNNMQIVSSLLNLQSQNIEDKKYRDVFIDSQSRIYAMALIHEKLYQSDSLAQINLKEYIDGIVSNIFQSYGQKSNIKIDLNIENVPIKIDYAVPCGLIINEILTNSFKYAFPDGRQGIIKISVKSNDNNMIQFSISDDGIGITKDMDIRNTKSLGLKLITSLAESQLHGELILNRESGTEFQINFRQVK